MVTHDSVTGVCVTADYLKINPNSVTLLQESARLELCMLSLVNLSKPQIHLHRHKPYTTFTVPI
jgi:hypothetical protein